MTMYKAADGYIPHDLYVFGVGQYAAAMYLFHAPDRQGHYLDSAGYLGHMALELLLKAWHLSVAREFPQTHSLRSLWAKLEEWGKAPALTNDQRAVLRVFDEFEELRYPSPERMPEIGTDHGAALDEFVGLLNKSLPSDVTSDPSPDSGHFIKGGRVLMKRKVLPGELTTKDALDPLWKSATSPSAKEK